MKNKIVMWLGVLALVFVPAQVLRAQQGPEGGGAEDVEITEGGPGPAHAEMGIQRNGPGEGRMNVKVRKIMMGGEQGGGTWMGGRGFMPEEELLALIKKYDPVFAKKVEDLKETAPAKYHMVLQMSGKMMAGAKMEEDEAVEKDAVRTMSLEFDVKELSRKLEKAADAEKGAIKDTLKAKISELFDLKSKAQELRVKRMDADLTKLKKNLESRKANKAKIVEQRLEQITGEGYSW